MRRRGKSVALAGLLALATLASFALLTLGAGRGTDTEVRASFVDLGCRFLTAGQSARAGRHCRTEAGGLPVALDTVQSRPLTLFLPRVPIVGGLVGADD